MSVLRSEGEGHEQILYNVSTMPIAKLNTPAILVGIIFFMMSVADATAGRRALRIDFDAWSAAHNITDTDFCPRYFSGSALIRGAFVFQNDQFPDPYLTNAYCQDIPVWDPFSQPDVYSYLNSEVIPSDEAGLAAKIGENRGVEPITAERYTFLDGDEFEDGTSGYQWAFYSFPNGVTLVALYGDSPVQSDGYSPFIYYSPDSDDLIWKATINGFDGQYFCFELGEFIGFWDGEIAGTEPADGCTMEFVSSRDALAALYESTKGDGWIDDTNWLTGDPCGDSWHEVYCNAENTVIKEVYLGGNNLDGTLPAELGTGSLSDLEVLYLNNNKLTGNIPTELGNLANLYDLWLDSNQLTGAIPVELANIDSLGSIGLRWNGLYTNDPALDAFLDSKGGSWSATQTIAPANPVITNDAPEIELAWDAIEYTEGTGRYRAWYSTSPGGPFTDGGATANKTVTTLTIPGLQINTTYYVVLRSETDAHGNNQNDIESENSPALISISNEVFIDGFE
jgi:hypothetical protein